VYISLAGLAVLVAPATTFGVLFAFLPSTGWLRIGGVLCQLFGAYYIGAAADDAEGRRPLQFYRATVWGRAALTAAFVALWAAGECERGVLVLAAINAMSAWVLHRAMIS
jgi:uncharacterized membrane protein